MLVVLDLGDGRRFACETFEYAKEAWLKKFAECLGATIEVYPEVGSKAGPEIYRYDHANRIWVTSK
ncbi:hypothetical protein TA5114_02054 [Cognatishimia activa]|uniref:Uncharacterized protein n=1 Tax=Cognatishimia activa TaxID=1715691 RepID=A0A0P1IRM6_9RHOB|nr:hypothetical protein TA5113_01971 [Cognatishimia activa]CUK26245.1 hypothetical protein TA5114_02054 [Cognatishimia activa]